MEESFLHSFYEILFTFLPVPFFLQTVDILAALLDGFYALLGIDVKIIGF